MSTASHPVVPTNERLIALWLVTCCAMVFAMVVIGGITRLTDSGLSMVEWKPLVGVLPPLSEVEWERVFGLYKDYPQYRLHNSGMSLEEFKGIFWWEWFHRLFAHLIGIVFVVPFLWFWRTGRVSPGLMPRLVGLLLLGGLQGVIGWLMVASGLVDRPAVSHYRLAIHLLTATVIYLFMLWVALGLLVPPAPAGLSRAWGSLRLHLRTGLLAVLVTMTWGAFVAGLRAGKIYNTFPMMGDYFLPPEALDLVPTWLNFLENPNAVQFAHRWIAISTGALLLSYVWRVRLWDIPTGARVLSWLIGVAVLGQIGLGIATLVLVVPINVAAAHQAGAIVLLTVILATLHQLRFRQGVA